VSISGQAGFSKAVCLLRLHNRFILQAHVTGTGDLAGGLGIMIRMISMAWPQIGQMMA